MLSRKATVKQGSIHSQDGAIWDREAAQWLRGYTALAIQSPASGSGGSQPLETLVPGFQCLWSPRPAVSTCIPNTHNLKKMEQLGKKDRVGGSFQVQEIPEDHIFKWPCSRKTVISLDPLYSLQRNPMKKYSQR